MGCHFLLHCMQVKSESEDSQLCLTLHDPMDCSLLGSSIHGIFQARVLEWVAIAFSELYMEHDLSWCLRAPHFLFPSPTRVPRYSTYDSMVQGSLSTAFLYELLEGEYHILLISIIPTFNIEGTPVFKWVNKWRFESLSVGKTGFEHLDWTWWRILICCTNLFQDTVQKAIQVLDIAEAWGFLFEGSDKNWKSRKFFFF